MKTKSFLSLLAIFLIAPLFAQEGTVEKSVINVQIGAIGFWGNYEARLGNKWALRAEAGFDTWWYDSAKDGSGSVLVPSINIEPRYYYNIGRRHERGKNTSKNSANFVTVSLEYYPDAFVLGNLPSYLYVPNQLHIIPKWGIRRMIGQHFSYEAGAGIGYQTFLSSDPQDLKQQSNVAVDIHLRLGYTF
jgi:hypothetical protein